MFGLTALAVFITYWRLPPEELFRTSFEGLEAGASRALVLVNFPISLAAIAIVGVLLEHGARSALGALAIALCAVTAVPGVVDQYDLDARWVNAIPAIGVGLAAAMTVAERPRLELAPTQRLDRLRIVLAVITLAIAVPWFFAEVGLYAPDPLYADEFPATGETELRAVHLGHHHGIDGALLTLAALLFSRVAHTPALRAYTALMFVYGVANMLEDAWNEQIVKRGWTEVKIPSALVPEPTVTWAVVLALAAIVYATALRRPAT
jgi:hypothetical protein